MALHLCYTNPLPCAPMIRSRVHIRRLRFTATAAQNSNQPTIRSTTTGSSAYQPNIWDYHHIQSLMGAHEDETQARRIEVLKEEVRDLFKEQKGVVGRLELVDALQQLGVSYHFEDEIMDVLGSIPVSAENVRMALKDDLRSTALLFRILREHGSFVSQDVFDTFKDERGGFKTSVCGDVRGVLSLYEATYFSIKEEETMDDARAFTTKHLQCLMEESLDPCVRERVAHALELPLNWRMPRLHTRWFIDVYERDEGMNPILLEFAKRDFNMVQGCHQRELKDLLRWWTNLGFRERLPFARDRLVESYMLTVTWAFQPKFWKFREALTKFNTILTTVDDVYDVYGSMEELELFTDAIERWDADAMEQLPEYMKICYLALFNSVNDAAYQVLSDKGLDITQHLKKAWAIQCNSYLKEAKWLHSQYRPTFKDYMDNGMISLSCPLIHSYSYYFVSHNVTDEALGCLKSYSNIVYHSSMICRLLNDLATSTDEVNRGDGLKSIQCLMHQTGVSETVAREIIKDMISELWKELNRDRFVTPFEKPYISNGINVARSAHYMYQDIDRYGNPDRRAMDQGVLLLIEPFSLKNCI